jgi:hypothetical protein
MKCYCQGYGQVEVLDDPIRGGCPVRIRLESGAETIVQAHQLDLPSTKDSEAKAQTKPKK